MPLTPAQQRDIEALRGNIPDLNAPPLDMAGMDLRGVDLGQHDLSHARIDAETLSRASGLENVQGVNPVLLMEAERIKPHVDRLDALHARLDKLNSESGIGRSLLGNLRHIGRGGVEGEKNHLNEEIAKELQALQQTQDTLARQLPGNQNDFEIKDSYTVGTEVTKRLETPESLALKKLQASETFKMDSTVALDQRGTTFAIGKAGVGYKTARIAATDRDSPDLLDSAAKDINILGTAAHLYGKYDEVLEVGHDDIVQETLAKTEVLGADTTTLLTRAVATSEVNKALGMDAVSEERFAIDEHGDPMTLSVGVPGAPVLDRPSDPTKQEQYLDIPYREHAIQKGLYDLEVQDYITGQIDRHTGNIFIDPNDGTVRGIDNDLAFPVVPREQMLKDKTNSSKAVENKPLFMHSDTADKIEAMSPAALRKTLESIATPDGVAGLEPAAIDGTVQRLVEMQDHIKDLRQQGRVVDQFGVDTYEAAIQHQIDHSPEGTLANRQNKSLPTSYLGAAVAEGVKTDLFNAQAKEHEKRNKINGEGVPPVTIDPQFAAYRQAVAHAKQDVLANPQQLQDSGLAQTITTKALDVADFEKKLASDTAFLKATQDKLKTAIDTGDGTTEMDERNTLQTIQEMRQGTLQQLNAARSDLNRALDRAVDGQKTVIAQAALAGELQLNQDLGQGQDQNQGWQPIVNQPPANLERKFNIGQRQTSNPDLGAQSSSPSMTPPVPSPAVAASQTEAPSLLKTPPRPALTHPGRPLPPIPGSERKAEAEEVKAETPEKKNTVKEDVAPEIEGEKKEHSRKNSVGRDINWQRPSKPDSSNEKNVKEGFFRK